MLIFTMNWIYHAHLYHKCWLTMFLGAGYLRWVLACRTMEEKIRLLNLSHGKCEFGNYELLYSCSMINRRVVNILFGTNELAPTDTLQTENKRN